MWHDKDPSLLWDRTQAFTDNDDVSIWVKTFLNKTQNKGQSFDQ